MSRPFGKGNPDLWQLKKDIEDDRFIRIIDDLSRITKRSAQEILDASQQNDGEYDHYIESESAYREEIIGCCFLVFQTKVRRVVLSAEVLHKAMKDEHQIGMKKFKSHRCIRNIEGRYKRKHASLMQLIWDVGNYYKHRDEWPGKVWHKRRPKEKKNGLLERSRETQKSVERIGITFNSMENMRVASKFFDVDLYSDCRPLAENVQNWAENVYKTVLAGLSRIP